jgi:hypothetical protein
MKLRELKKIGSSENVSLGERTPQGADEWGSRSGTASDRRIIYTIDIVFAEDTSISMLEANDSRRDSPQRSPRCDERKKREIDDDGKIHRRLPIKGRFVV